MGKLIVTEFVTLDGVMEDPGGAEAFERGGWAFQFDRGDVGNRFKVEELEAADAQLLGRLTYDGFAQAWPSRTGDPFSDKMNAMPKHVVTSSPLEPEWQNSQRLEGDLEPAVRALKESYTGDILVAGSARLVQSLTELRLVDEYRFMLYPVLLGAGKKLFAESDAVHRLRNVSSQTAGDCQILVYVPESD